MSEPVPNNISPALTLITPDGYAKLQDELTHLTHEKRSEIAQRLRDCMDHGEFSEDNSELDEVKFEQAMVETRIADLKTLFAGGAVIDLDDLDTDEVGVGNTVKVKDLERGVEFEVRVVCSIEADPDQDYISSESPMGQAMMGRKVGDKVRFEAPAGIIQYEIAGIGK